MNDAASTSGSDDLIELNEEQVLAVSGGILPLAALAFVYYERQQIRDFVGGALDGFHGTRHMEP